jgi:cysteine desulfuration protein SufE
MEGLSLPSWDEIQSDFDLIEDWEERYRYIIELGRRLEPLPETVRNDDTKVAGCASQVWLHATWKDSLRGSILTLRGDSDAHIVKGLVALIIILHEGHTRDEILTLPVWDAFSSLGLVEHLTPQRSNGVRAMITRLRQDAVKEGL